MNYPYANGIIKTLEYKILDKTKLIRLTHDSPEAMLNALKELNYGTPEARDLESLIAYEYEKLMNLYTEIAPEPEYLSLLFLNEDAINIKGLLKEKLFGPKFTINENTKGLFSPEELKTYIIEAKPNKTKKYNKLFKEIIALEKEELSARILSAKVDRIIYNFAMSEAKTLSTWPLYVYFQTKIDYTNLLSFFRARKLFWNIEEFMEMTLPGGTISLEKLREIYLIEDNIQATRELKEYELGKLSQDLIARLEQDDLGVLEIYFENCLLKKAREFYSDPFSIGPLLYYGLLKKAEAQNIRTIAGNPHFDATYLLDY